MECYYATHGLTLLLVLSCHLGYQRYVPIFELEGISSYPCPTNICDEVNDTLLLSWSWDDSTYMPMYREHIHAFLRDPHRSGVYTLRHDTYEKAAEYCIGKLISLIYPPILPYNSAVKYDGQDDDVSPLYLSEDGRWKWKFIDPDTAPMVNSKELYFILTGYLIFLLPQCQSYKPLLHQCRAYLKRFSAPLGNPYPQRTRLLHKEISSYLGLCD